MKAEPADRLLTLRQAAEILQVHRDTVYGYVRRGEIPAVKIGGRWTISERLLWESVYEKSLQPATDLLFPEGLY